jgi:hypothetical protein
VQPMSAHVIYSWYVMISLGAEQTYRRVEDYCINYNLLCTSPLPPCIKWDHKIPTLSHIMTCHTIRLLSYFIFDC